MSDAVAMTAHVVGEGVRVRHRAVRLRDHEDADPTARTCPRCEAAGKPRRLTREEFDRATSLHGPEEHVVRWRCVQQHWNGQSARPCGWFEDEGESADAKVARTQWMDEKRAGFVRGAEVKRANRERRATEAPASASPDTPPASPPRGEEAPARTTAPTVPNAPHQEAPQQTPEEEPDMPRPIVYTPAQITRFMHLVMEQGWKQCDAEREVGMRAKSGFWHIKKERERIARSEREAEERKRERDKRRKARAVEADPPPAVVLLTYDPADAQAALAALSAAVLPAPTEEAGEDQAAIAAWREAEKPATLRERALTGDGVTLQTVAATVDLQRKDEPEEPARCPVMYSEAVSVEEAAQRPKLPTFCDVLGVEEVASYPPAVSANWIGGPQAETPRPWPDSPSLDYLRDNMFAAMLAYAEALEDGASRVRSARESLVGIA